MYIFDTKQKIHYFLLFMIFSYFCECCLFSSVLATKVKKKMLKTRRLKMDNLIVVVLKVVKVKLVSHFMLKRPLLVDSVRSSENFCLFLFII